MIKETSAGNSVMRRLDELSRFSAQPDALTRLYLSPEHKEAARQVQAWMQTAGMTARLDASGNVAGRYEGTTPDLPAIILGSHIDTVRNAGKYDGALGVVAAIEAVARLHETGERLPFAVEVIAFGDEEGVRFPSTLAGSRAVAGTFDPGALDATDRDGISVGQALREFGCDPAGIASVARRPDRVLAYCEVHIEQGPVLEAEDLPVGVVTAIAGAARYTAVIEGVAGHAGTVPMRLRHDAVCAAAEMVLAAEGVALDTDELVATVGVIEASPGAVNVVPGGARFTLDIRSPSDALRAGAVDRLEHAFAAIAERRGVTFRWDKSYEAPAAPCAGSLIEQFSAAVQRAGIRPHLLPSGAGHDGLAMAALCPIAMLFVRCKGGISHNPAEAITETDADAAVMVLIDFLRHFTPHKPGTP